MILGPFLSLFELGTSTIRLDPLPASLDGQRRKKSARQPAFHTSMGAVKHMCADFDVAQIYVRHQNFGSRGAAVVPSIQIVVLDMNAFQCLYIQR